MGYYSDIIKDLRRSRGLSQEELAGLAGVSRHTVVKAEADEDVRLSTMEKLLEALGMTISVIPRPWIRQPHDSEVAIEAKEIIARHTNPEAGDLHAIWNS